MKIAVIGGTGRVSTHFIRHALSRGHEIKALVRNIHKAEEMLEGAELVLGDAKNQEDIRKTLTDCEVVFCGLSTDKSDTLTTAVPLLTDEMERQSLKRLVTIGTAGILDSRFEDGKYRFESSESKRSKTFAAEEHAGVYQHLQKTTLEWTIVCPTYLPEGDVQGGVRFELDRLPEDGKKVTTGDTAVFAYQTLINDQFLQKRVGICY
ncbi:NAD(P)H-binding protein [Halobacillus kuroshimensis]|uniref:NAD(P)H-binding protein n=1 Tax=Halobacillus kuroshimensis TaxID=302481 RepID=A0ABS3DQN5_9BACI|nr:NAD(P)H-binding protein [Halobacillus kuroshimensis]MBN8233617.1 NAD(P)H-binding protein [Halobacillus kuroshimensis]